MSFFSDLQGTLDALRGLLGDDLEAAEIPSAVTRLCDDAVVTAIADASALIRGGESLRIAASGVVAARSTREKGHSGLAQVRGHRSPVSLIQDLTGATRADAAKQVRLGEALAAGLSERDAQDDRLPGRDDVVDDTDDAAGTDAAAPAPVASRRPWHAPLGDALLARAISPAQHDAILRGLGEPPVGPDGGIGISTTEAGGGDPGPDADTAVRDASDAAVRDAWELAATELIAEAPHRTVEELGRTARTLRDQLDPEGAQRRFDERFQGRSFRMWTDADGIHSATLKFDDHGAAWIRSIIDSALRPRRGGPRFVDPTEKARAKDLTDDPRTNDQLAYDLILDVLRAGALADAESVFGTRQAGVRVVITADAREAVASGSSAVGLIEDDQTTLPGWLVAQYACDTGLRECTLDRQGNPLYLGRESRLYSPKQRLMLALRDGGCRWRGCDRPASYCEAHHIDDYAEGGCTDIDRGILLCRFHHMNLHHGGWRITRNGLDDFVLHPPPGQGAPIVLKPRLALRYAWDDLDPPPRRFRLAA